MIDLLFIGVPIQKTNPLIASIVIEQNVEEPTQESVETPKQYTIEEKVKLNVNNCNTDTQYIRADNAECLDKPVYKPTTAQNPARGAVNQPQSRASSGWYDYGYCTWYVSTRRSVGQWNNARDWAWQARRDGWNVSSTPTVGAIAQKGNHVAYVESVNGNTMTISEMNYVGWNVRSSRTIQTSGWTFIQ